MLSFICENCQKAADLWSNAKKRSPQQHARSKRWHEKCTGGTQCDCQHRM